MKHHLIPRIVARLLLPFILLFGLYVQFHGDYSPGGGFQAGVIFAVAYILYAILYGLAEVKRFLGDGIVRFLAALGVLLYAGTGVASLFLGRNFLDYSALSEDAVFGQELGIWLVELGVGITVFSVMVMIFYAFAGYHGIGDIEELED